MGTEHQSLPLLKVSPAGFAPGFKADGMGLPCPRKESVMGGFHCTLLKIDHFGLKKKNLSRVFVLATFA